MHDDVQVTRAEYDRLLKKLQVFAETLSANEQIAFARVLRGADPSRASGRGDFPGEAWQDLMGIVANNGGTKP